MKKIYLLLVLLAASQFLMAQNGISFQGIARDASGNAVSSQSVTVKFTIGSWNETQTLTTDNFGVFSATIGSVNTTDFDNLVFANMNDNLKVEVDGTVIYDDKFNYTPYAKAADNGVPPGTIVPFAGPKGNVPSGWLYCDGASYATTGMYGKLFAAVGFSWGSDNGKFRVPDLRGYFLRGASDGTGVDPDRAGRTAKYGGGSTGDAVGSYQGGDIQSHNHGVNDPGHAHGYWDIYYSESGGPQPVPNNLGSSSTDGDNGGYQMHRGSDSATTNISIQNSGGNETRPVNANVIFIVKY